jgi:hypothetical protein
LIFGEFSLWMAEIAPLQQHGQDKFDVFHFSCVFGFSRKSGGADSPSSGESLPIGLKWF